MTLDLNTTADWVIAFLGVMCWVEFWKMRKLLEDRTGPVWKPTVTYHTKTENRHPEKPQVKMRTGPKNPMIYPKTDEQLAQREALLEKNAGKDLGF